MFTTIITNSIVSRVQVHRKEKEGQMRGWDVGRGSNFTVKKAGFYAFLLCKNYLWPKTGTHCGLKM